MSSKIPLLSSVQMLGDEITEDFFPKKVVSIFHLRPDHHDIVMLYYHNSASLTMTCNLISQVYH